MPTSSLQRSTACLLILLAVSSPFASVHADSGPATATPGSSIGDFEITRFEVTGNTLLEPAAVQSLVAGFAGRNRHFSHIEQAMAALEGAYREQGFGLVKVVLPEQELNDGVVHLTVVETRIGQLRVAGNQFHSEANIRRSLPALADGAVPNTRELSADLRMANENPSKRANLKLQSGDRAGIVDAVLEIADARSWSAGALVDNSGNDASGRSRVTAQYQNFNVGGLDHVFSAHIRRTPRTPTRFTSMARAITFRCIRSGIRWISTAAIRASMPGVVVRGLAGLECQRRWHSARHALQSQPAASRKLRLATDSGIRPQGIS